MSFLLYLGISVEVVEVVMPAPRLHGVRADRATVQLVAADMGPADH